MSSLISMLVHAIMSSSPGLMVMGDTSEQKSACAPVAEPES
jgi:hypothetical protein